MSWALLSVCYRKWAQVLCSYHTRRKYELQLYSIAKFKSDYERYVVFKLWNNKYYVFDAVKRELFPLLIVFFPLPLPSQNFISILDGWALHILDRGPGSRLSIEQYYSKNGNLSSWEDGLWGRKSLFQFSFSRIVTSLFSYFLSTFLHFILVESINKWAASQQPFNLFRVSTFEFIHVYHQTNTDILCKH